MKKEDVRRQLTVAGVCQWQLAEEIGIHEATLCAWLRHELTGNRLQRVKAALDKLTKKGADTHASENT